MASSPPLQSQHGAVVPNPMSMNLLMLSWVAASFPHARHQALLCLGGSDGYHALKRSLGPGGYPEHTILLTNVDIMDVGVHTRQQRRNDMLVMCLLRQFHVPNPYRTWGMGVVNQGARGYVYSLSEDYHFDHPCVRDILSLKGREVKAITNVSEIPEGFLIHCAQIRRINFSGFDNVSELPSGFLRGFRMQMLYGCSSFSNITEIPERFLENCAELRTINFEGLHNVTTIRPHFLSGCTALNRLDLSPFANKVKVLPPGFLSEMVNLRTVCFGRDQWRSLEALPEGFLQGCSGLKSSTSPPSPTCG